MAAQDNDTTALIDAVRRDSFMAQSGQSDNWTDPRILGVADDCTLKWIAPALKRTKQGWFRIDFDIPMVAEQSRYDTPQEAMWNGIEAVWLENPTSRVIEGKVSVVDESNRMQYGWDNPGIPQYAWFDHTQIVFSPAPSSDAVSAYSMTASAYRRPAQLVLPDETARVLAVNSVTQVLTVASIPSAFTVDPYTSGTPYRLDIYNKNLPNTRLMWNHTMSSPSVTALAFAPTITAESFATISVGDVLTMKGTSPYPDLPPDGVPFLRDMVVRTILTAQTDMQGLQVYLGQQSESLGNFLKGMSNRADGSPRKLSLSNAGTARFMRNYSARYRRY